MALRHCREGGEELQRLPLPTLVAIAWTALLGLMLVLGVPFGVVGEWVWNRRQIFPFAFPSLLLTFASLAFLFALAARFSSSIGGCFALFVVAILFRFSFVMLTPMQPASAFWALAIASPVATTFFTEARQVEREGLSHYLRHYHKMLPQKPFHAATHPPGLPLTFAALRAIARHPLLQRWAPLDDATLSGMSARLSMMGGIGCQQSGNGLKAEEEPSKKERAKEQRHHPNPLHQTNTHCL